MNLNIEDFTLDNYMKIVEVARQTYRFVSFEEACGAGNFVAFWRHDIDFSVSQAVQMANIEKSKEVFSTFFVQLSSKFYNVFEHETRDSILAIKEMGHHIGLHFDPTLYNISNDHELERKLQFEKRILEGLFDLDIKVFSLHMPTATPLCTDKFQYAGMSNVYSSFFRDKMEYCSDSNGYWRFQKLIEVILKKPTQLHVLTHPVWWTKKALSPMNRLKQCIDKRSHDCENWYRKILKDFNRKG